MCAAEYNPRQQARPPAPQQGPPPERPKNSYRGNSFTLNLFDGWHDETLYSIYGPVTDGIQHNIIIVMNRDVTASALVDYADWNIASVEGELKGCRVLKREEIKLLNGMPAYRAIFRWYPNEKMRIFQEQIYVLVGTTGYKLTASFSKKTRKTLGPSVEQMMLSFTPQIQEKPKGG
jgi:hypothetical protein